MPRKTNKRKAHNPHKRIERAAAGLVMQMKESDGKNEEGNYTWTANMNWSNCKVILATPMRWFLRVWVQLEGEPEPREEILLSAQCLLADLQEEYTNVKVRMSLDIGDKKIIDRGWTARPLTRALKAQLDQTDEKVPA